MTHETIQVAGKDGPNTLSFTHTNEGFVTDIDVSREEDLNHNLASRTETLEEVIERLGC